LSDLSKVADQLTFAAIADFVGPRSDTDGLGSLQKTYGGFKFKTINQVDIKIKYEALRQGQADAAVAFTTDGEIAGYGFVLMADDKNNFPPYQMIPVVRPDILAAYPNMKDIINKVSAVITTDKISALNWQVDGPTKRDTTDVAKEYLKAQGIIK
jgi:osmoprotectant transport system substrate-binding protein